MPSSLRKYGYQRGSTGFAGAVGAAAILLTFRQVRIAKSIQRRQHLGMYTPMLDLISNRLQQTAGAVASKSKGVAMEHRWGQRSNLNVQVRLHATSWRAPRRGRLRNISASGALLETEPSLPPLKRVEVEIAVRKAGDIDLIRIPACVVRKADRGVGVEWCETPGYPIEQLVAYATDSIGPPPFRYSTIGSPGMQSR